MEQNLWLAAQRFSFWYWKLGGTVKKSTLYMDRAIFKRFLRIKIIETNSFEKGSSLLVSWPARLFSFRLHWIVLKSSLHTGVVSSFIMVTVESFLDRRGIWNQEKWVKHEKLFVPLFLENLHCRQKNLDQFAEWDYIISNVGLGCFPSRVETELMEQWCYIYYCDMVRGE